MSTSLKDLFEVHEGFDPKEEMIAKILMNTSDEDNNPADEPFQELARKLETDEISIEDALSSLDAMTQEDMEEAKAFKITTTTGDEEIKTFKDNKEAQDFRKNNTNVKNTEELKEELDDEGRMAKSDLLKLTQYSAKLYKALGDQDQLPAWIQAKITLAADYIGTVKHYLEGEQVMGGEEAPEGQLEEAAGDVEYYNWEDLHLAIFATEDKPLEDVPETVYLPLASDARKMLGLKNFIRVRELPEDYKSEFGTKQELVARELGYLERDFYKWKDSFEGMIEGDEEVTVTCGERDAKVEVPTIAKASDAYSAGKAKGNTKDVYETSIIKMLSK
jgi:hypothetical protein